MACVCQDHPYVVASHRMHVLQAGLLRAAWMQQGNVSVPTFSVEDIAGPDLDAFLATLNVWTTCISNRSALVQAKEFKASIVSVLNDDEWLFMIERTMLLMDEGLSKLSEAGRKALKPFLDEMRSLLGRVAYEGMNPMAASQLLMDQYLPQYADWQFARLCRTELAYADNVARDQVFNKILGADDGALSRVAGETGMTFPKPPWHPNCLCPTSVVEGTDGKIYVFPNPAPSACGLCQDMADYVLNQLPLVGAGTLDTAKEARISSAKEPRVEASKARAEKRETTVRGTVTEKFGVDSERVGSAVRRESSSERPRRSAERRLAAGVTMPTESI